MHSLSDWQQRYDDVEAMLKGAGDYVQPSDDLRPQVIEAARTIRGEQRGKRWVRRFAFAATILGAAVTLYIGPGNQGLKGVDSDDLHRQAALKSSGAGSLGWGLVQALIDLRAQQAEQLNSD
ncbi:hypothetical protein [Lacipirellula sp.]|uniref:hypothetical protein n=1 Tax=Lacipirellula sp. TaxID=2691419 RepID=UPI003D0C20BF